MAEKTYILLAEDEAALGQIVKESLETRDFKVDLAEDGDKAYKLAAQNNYDALVLDVMMPKKDGFTLAKEIRQEDDTIPIIFLTAKSQTSDVVEGFSIGGNDYLKKPFSMEELIVRIHNLVQRKKLQKNSELLTIGSYLFNFPKQTLQYEDDELVLLTHREAHLLFHLVKNKNQVLDRSLILNKLWNTDDFFAARSMDVFISKLRKKLAKDESIQIINVRGYGYKLTC
ncbi:MULTISPECIES: response regulator transcription factor [unclassified Leeuwenhoekiella]|uniref:response regulator transcription factor n=1 Tax=unclassified Leeuwenhoekiella TaxID=2615029 RepID=UPI000C545BAD|nr:MULTISPECIES: response regulator transcription factor [unclassified Leeuwenhoekiella]MBA82535.1 DNA-binding response regulator [Leeuwenhoekiella sp.]|tara:strand:+ start:18874 stop:19557 length:684 start_codon:yes stop_codon:yes gene_type:complete